MYKVKEENYSFGKAFDIVKNSIISPRTNEPYLESLSKQNQSSNPVSLGMRLPSWNEGTCVFVQVPDTFSKQTHPYLYVESRFGRVPWVCTVPEMFRNDWQIVEFIED